MEQQTRNLTLQAYFSKRLLAFANYFEVTAHTLGVEELHKFRVEIKKHRAFLRFLETLSNGEFSDSEHQSILGTIFKPGGRLRETHVNQSLVLLYRSYALEGYKNFLITRKIRQTKKLQEAFLQFQTARFDELNKETAALLSAFSINLVLEKAFAFINFELESIKTLRPFIAKSDDLHQIRTHTKAMGYIAKFIIALQPNEQSIELLKMTKPTEKLIGNWHDRVVLSNSLAVYLKKNPTAPDTTEEEKLIRQIAAKNKLSVKIIANRLDGFINFHV